MSTVLSNMRARRTDPESSHIAAANACEFAGTHAQRILAALEEISTGTAHEIAVESGLTVVQVDRRLCELERGGRVYILTMAGKPLIRDGFRVWARCAA